MASAFVIEARGRQAGLIVRVAPDRFRFFAAVSETTRLEGAEFVTPSHARRAAEKALSAAGRTAVAERGSGGLRRAMRENSKSV